jgi:ABC-type antimicrobial peptide transport system permease subunit
LVADTVFRILYPSVPGSRVFLVNGQAEKKEEIETLLDRNFRDYGMEISYAPERLASFYAVQNTYLNVFILLGGIGLIIGTLGIGILIFRSVLERRQELGILRAVGFTRSRIIKILLTENTLLLFAGIVAGSLSAVISTLPSFLASGTGIPVNLILSLLLLLMIFGSAVVFLSVVFSTKRNLVETLKSE